MEKRFKKWAAPRIRDGQPTKWNWVVQHPENLKLGKLTDIGAFSYINARYGVIIEDEVQIGSHTSIYSESTIDGKKGPVCLRENSRVGSHSVIMPGVTVGRGSVVGAFSFIDRDIPSGVTAVGIPARIIKKRRKREKAVR